MEMAVNNNNPEDNDPGEVGPGSSDALVQNPVRLTIGHYYCANCGEDPLTRGDAKCPRCQDKLRWDGITL